MSKVNEKRKRVFYNRRAWWPSFWTVVAVRGKWQVQNGKTNKALSPLFDSENEAVFWADTNSSTEP